MTQWGMLLLCAYLALGLSRMSRRKAGRLAVALTALVIGAAFAGYMTSGPPAPVATLSGDGVTNPSTASNGMPSTENTDGRQQETPVTAGSAAAGTASNGSTTSGSSAGSGS